MLDNLRRMAIFVAVADAGSFSAAARRLHLSTSVVSHHVSALEESLGATLLYRSTRAVSTTDEGQRLLKSARKMLDAATEGFEALSRGGDLVGSIRVTTPRFLSGGTLEAAIWEFARRHPGVAMKIEQSDQRADLIGEGIDLAIRLGEMPSSDLRARKIGVFERKVVCSPAYLEAFGPIETPEDLRRSDFVVMDRLAEGFRLFKENQRIDIATEKRRITVDSVAAACQAVLAGLGVQRPPTSEVGTHLADGRLVELIPDWRLPVLDIHAVWPASRHGATLTSHLVAHMLESR